MCGRYTIVVSMEELMLRYLSDLPTDRYHRPRYNVAPMQQVLAVIHDGERNRLGELRWGLVPSWAGDEKIGSRMINARAETLLEKPAFRQLVSRKRCIVPADGFYEWKAVRGGKQPMRITLKEEAVFSFAALYDTWVHPEDGRKISTCTIITTEPNRLVADIHNRMPVILRREDEALWLDRRNGDVQQAIKLLRPYPAEEMRAYPVSAKVGNVKNDTADCLDEIALEA
ncbi:SOS response-associated peptidase [Paenibacillus chartarius]|uniref:Abasic site processing protein n=1 Tax=Paenibacillus chartarius TaxID=747481 RepID=A0ABV6DKL0_9BACL